MIEIEIEYEISVNIEKENKKLSFTFSLEEIEEDIGINSLLEQEIEKYIQNTFCTCNFNMNQNHCDCEIDYELVDILKRSTK